MPSRARSRVIAVAIASHAVLFLGAGPAPRKPAGSVVTGRVAVIERGNKLGADVGQAVVWLEVPGAPPLKARPAQVSTEAKEFRPRVSIIPAGSTVTFPNNDPFNHNVFSLSEEGPFDLGLYGRGQAKSSTFNRAGIVRVYCNVHATMAAFLIVRDNEFVAQPGADGGFSIADVPPGKYTIHVWHERAQPISRELEVSAGGVKDLELQLDARAYKFVQHLNKFGQPYSKGGSRY